MENSKPAERVVKGWYVEAKFPDDKVPHQISRVYHVRESAMTYAAELRKAHPAAQVNVRSRTGTDDAGGICGQAFADEGSNW
jgi:hypothetical protein